MASADVEYCGLSNVSANFGRGFGSSYTALALSRLSERKPLLDEQRVPYDQ